jgi:hypothetical protein
MMEMGIYYQTSETNCTGQPCQACFFLAKKGDDFYNKNGGVKVAA